MYKTPEYLYQAVWSEKEKCFIGSVKEFPNIRTLGIDVSATINQLKTMVREELDILFKDDKPFPAAVSSRVTGK